MSNYPTNQKIIIISGPTASGKTQMAIDLALSLPHHSGEIINFDSLLFYQELNIGSAKPTLKEMKGVPHHLIGVSSIKNTVNAADFVQLAAPLIEKLHQENKIIILVGGSGFYLRALLQGMYPTGETPTSVKEKSEAIYHELGIAPFLEILKEVDPNNFEKLHPNDHYRIRRAVEYWWSTSTPFSLAKTSLEEKQKNLAISMQNKWNSLHIYLDLDKGEHQKIIEQRTHKMFEQGLVKEVQDLLDHGHSGEERPLQSIGYWEVLAYLRGEISTLDECRERINISTRQLAKAQRTWFKKINDKKVYNPILDRDKILTQFHEFQKIY